MKYTKNILRLIFSIAMLFVILPVCAQPNITNVEYFIDIDPGVGNGLPLTITPGTSFDISPDLIQSLAPGTHVLSVRAKNANGTWGFAERRSFFIPSSPTTDPPVADISAMEYYIDEDLGFGLGTPIIVSTGNIVDIASEIIEITDLSLPSGFHTIGIRTRNTDNVWGFAEHRVFYIPGETTTDPPVADMVELEYFIDDDPGHGSANPITIATGQALDINELIPGSLTPGYHSFNIRAKNTDGAWGMIETRSVYVKPTIPSESPSDIVKLEYYVDSPDPGVGNATNLPISPGPLLDYNTIDVPMPGGLADGEHLITFRAQNADGVWGMAELDTFDVLDDCMQPIAAFTPSLACAGQSVTFLDNSTSIQGDAQYFWYLNGDAIVDDNTVGNSSFTYNFPGTYVVSLAIRQGSICLDSAGTTIDIQPLPVAVFSSSGTELNNPTYFTASASNLPAGATWEWDFDEDGTPDDYTAGNTSYTFLSEATFNVSLTITDGLGCAVTVINPVTISSSGGGGSTPTANFLAENSCRGNSISFVDLSQNLPVGSVYSWDFDGDGVEDSSTAGNQNYVYPAKGSYLANLTIDLGGSSIEATRAIEIVDVPTADFSAADVCEGSITDFTDLSTNTESSAVYMWDFDNDGVIDSNAKTGVSFTFASAGSHIVSLTISNGYGCTNTVIRQVKVINLPTPDFDWDIVCTGETISFNDLSSGAETSATYSWDLDGDGTEDMTTAGDVSYTYANKGIYNPSLLITNPAGCTITITKPIEIFDRPEVAIDINARCYGQSSEMIDLSQKLSSTSIYSWDFDSDGIEDDNTVGNTSYTYPNYNSYLVTLSIDNGGGCTSSTEELVVFSDAATPDFIVNKTCQGEEVVFTDLSTNLETGAIYSWDFNSDAIEDAATPGSTSHTFNSAGSVDATLTIDNGGQCLAYKTITLDITPPPAVDLGEDLQLCSAGTLTFDAGVGYASYLWPDGSGLQTYTVDQIGSYMVRVQDAKGCFNYDTIAVELMGPPVPSFNHSIELSLEGIKVSFENTSTNADTYLWSLGDGITSSDAEPTHIYSDFSFYETSIYTVCLIAKNDCEDAQFCEDIFVSPTLLMQEGGDNIKMYPNPASQVVYVELNQASLPASKLALIDIQSKIHWYTNNLAGRQEINVSGLNRGIYYLVLETKNGFLYKKLMKN